MSFLLLPCPTRSGGIAAGASHPAEVSACLADYEASFADYMSMSRAITVHQRKEVTHAPFWENLMFQAEGVDPDPELAVARMSLILAEGQLQACHVYGGRYWDARVRLPRNCCASGIGMSRGGFCAPHTCTRIQVAKEVMLHFVQHILGLYKEFAPCLSCRPLVLASELAGWQDLSLDFVIAGLDRCGTTSLHKNLELHPDIGVTLDSLFFQTADVLPKKSRVEFFNSPERWRHVSPVGRRPPIAGLSYPAIYRSRLMREDLASVRGVKVLLIACDLVGRFEKEVWSGPACQKKLSAGATTIAPAAAAAAPAAAPPPRPLLAAGGRTHCLEELAAALKERRQLREWQVGRHLVQLQKLFGDRVMYIHQEMLRYKPCHTYKTIAEFLGAGPWPPGSRFRQHNSHKGPRTGLCGNASLLHAIRSHFAADHRLLDQLLSEAGVPPQLRRPRLRCQWKEELVAPQDGPSPFGVVGEGFTECYTE